MKIARILPAALPLLFFGCAEFSMPTNEDGVELDDLDPNDLRIGEVIYGCGGWWEGQMPAAEHVLVDVFFVAPSTRQSATPEEERWVSEQGGHIVYRHGVPAVRAEIPTRRIPDLVGQPNQSPVNHVRAVPDSARHDVVALVRYTRPVEEKDINRIEELGGRVRHLAAATSNLLSAELPDPSLRELRNSTAVDRIGSDLVFCSGI